MAAVTLSLLHFGKLCIFQFQQTLKGFHLILKIINPTTQLFIFSPGAFELFHDDGGAGVYTTGGITVTAGRTALFGITSAAVFTCKQSKLITASLFTTRLP